MRGDTRDQTYADAPANTTPQPLQIPALSNVPDDPFPSVVSAVRGSRRNHFPILVKQSGNKHWLGACPSSGCSNLSESDSGLGYEQVFSPLEYRSDTASAAECAGLRAERPCLAVYR